MRMIWKYKMNYKMVSCYANIMLYNAVLRWSVMLFAVICCYLSQCHVIMLCYGILCQVMSCHVMSCHTKCYVMLDCSTLQGIDRKVNWCVDDLFWFSVFAISCLSQMHRKNIPVLYCTVLYCTVLYCIVLYCTVLYCTVLYCIVV